MRTANAEENGLSRPDAASIKIESVMHSPAVSNTEQACVTVKGEGITRRVAVSGRFSIGFGCGSTARRSHQ